MLLFGKKSGIANQMASYPAIGSALELVNKTAE
jgi:hypothetical protein